MWRRRRQTQVKGATELQGLNRDGLFSMEGKGLKEG